MEKKQYEKPVVCIVHCMNERSVLAISGTHPGYDENDDEWGDEGGGAKESLDFFEKQWEGLNGFDKN